MDSRGIDLSGKSLTVVELLRGSGKFRNHQVTGHSQFRSLVFGISFEDCIFSESFLFVFLFGHERPFNYSPI